MDLLEFEGQDLYFDEQMPKEIDDLIKSASENYGTQQAEADLLQAFFLAPDNLSVLVALYRYYYYQHQYEKALIVAANTLKFSGHRVGFPKNWEDLTIEHVGAGALKSMSMVRFYLIALKATGYLNLRLHNFSQASEMLSKVVELDASDRLGAAVLLKFATDCLQYDDDSLIRVAEV